MLLPIILQNNSERNDIVDIAALALLIVGGINWLLVGLFQFDLVAWIFGGQDALLSRIIYIVVGLCALWCTTFFFRDGKLRGNGRDE